MHVKQKSQWPVDPPHPTDTLPIDQQDSPEQ